MSYKDFCKALNHQHHEGPMVGLMCEDTSIGKTRFAKECRMEGFYAKKVTW